MGKRNDRTGRTKENLLEAFWALYAERGLGGLTVKEIAARAGYNRGTFYQYFRGPGDCLEEVERRCIPGPDGLPPPIGSHEAPGADDPDGAALAAYVAGFKEKLGYYRVLLGERGDPAFRRRLIDSIHESALARLGPGAVGSFALEYQISGMIGVLVRYLSSEQPAAPEEIVAEVVRTILRTDPPASG